MKIFLINCKNTLTIRFCAVNLPVEQNLVEFVKHACNTQAHACVNINTHYFCLIQHFDLVQQL